MIVDKFNNEINVNDDIKIHYLFDTINAKVISIKDKIVNGDGYWIEIDDGEEVQSIMSYIIEVIK